MLGRHDIVIIALWDLYTAGMMISARQNFYWSSIGMPKKKKTFFFHILSILCTFLK